MGRHFTRSAFCEKCLRSTFVVAFAKLQKTPINSVISVRFSVRPFFFTVQLGFNWPDFREI